MIAKINISKLLQLEKSFSKEFKIENPADRAFEMALLILCHFLGKVWVNKYVLPPSNANKYLNPQPNTIENYNRSLNRIIEFAELLLNFQHTSGLEDKISAIKGGKIEETIAELVSAKIFVFFKIPFRFVVPSGKKRYDYDLELKIKNLKICCEIKCKIDQTDISNNTILSSLKKANNQLPAHKPGIILVSIPENWNNDKQIMTYLEKAIKRFYGQNDRIISIIFHLNDFLFQETFTTRSILIKEFVNNKNKFGAFQNILDSKITSQNWLTIRSLFTGNVI